jgi:hypothetical protein
VHVQEAAEARRRGGHGRVVGCVRGWIKWVGKNDMWAPLITESSILRVRSIML